MQTEDPSAVAADTLPQELKATARTEDGEIKDGWFKSYGGAEKAALSTCQLLLCKKIEKTLILK